MVDRPIRLWLAVLSAVLIVLAIAVFAAALPSHQDRPFSGPTPSYLHR